MFSILYDILFFGIPALLVILTGVSIYRFVSAKKKNRQAPGTFSEEEIRKRKIAMIVLSVITGVLAVIVIGLIVLLFMAVAYM